MALPCTPNGRYLLRLDRHGRACVALRPGASDETVLKALLHCAAFDAVGLRAVRRGSTDAGLGDEEQLALVQSLEYVARQWPAFCAAIEASGWMQAAVRAEHCCGPVRVRVHETS